MSDSSESLSNIHDPAVSSSSTSAFNILQEDQHVSGESTCIPNLEVQPESRAGHPSRSHLLPLRFRDKLPVPLPAIPEPQSTPILRWVVLYVLNSFHTPLNKFGIGRDYSHRPLYDQDATVSIDQLSNIMPDPPSLNEPANHSGSSPPSQSPPWPWRNMSIWRLISWKMSSNSGLTSESQVTRLVHEVLKAKDFSLNDVPDDFNTHTEMMRFDASEATLDSNDIFQRDGWRESAVETLVPTRERNVDGNGQLFTVLGFHHWLLVAVIRVAFSEASSH
ncbi:hypothetical protein BDR07DRAFT_1380620 [Suillus spraguei]|nr:hypothetical protein BDR07DRAFT_1380620 [Suillus spraguei]